MVSNRMHYVYPGKIDMGIEVSASGELIPVLTITDSSVGQSEYIFKFSTTGNNDWRSRLLELESYIQDLVDKMQELGEGVHKFSDLVTYIPPVETEVEEPEEEEVVEAVREEPVTQLEIEELSDEFCDVCEQWGCDGRCLDNPNHPMWSPGYNSDNWTVNRVTREIEEVEDETENEDFVEGYDYTRRSYHDSAIVRKATKILEDQESEWD